MKFSSYTSINEHNLHKWAAKFYHVNTTAYFIWFKCSRSQCEIRNFLVYLVRLKSAVLKVYFITINLPPTRDIKIKLQSYYERKTISLAGKFIPSSSGENNNLFYIAAQSELQPHIGIFFINILLIILCKGFFWSCTLYTELHFICCMAVYNCGRMASNILLYPSGQKSIKRKYCFSLTSSSLGFRPKTEETKYNFKTYNYIL